MKIIFMGTSEFADVSLRELIKEGYEICGVFCQTDKPVGRKQVLSSPVTKITAQNNNIPVYQPNSLKSDEVFKTIKEISPDMIVVVAYGKILPKNIIDIPKMGCINVHGSLLPKYRGAAPIQWSVINGDKQTGITTMFMNEGLDTGDILMTESTKIDEEETSGELFDRLSKIGAKLLVKTIKNLELGSIKPIKQDDSKATYAPPLNKEIGKLDFKKTSQELHNLIRGLNPWPIAYTTFKGKILKIYSAKTSQGRKGETGEVVSLKPFVVCCGQSTFLEFTQVQLEGKKKMTAEAFGLGIKTKDKIILGGEE